VLIGALVVILGGLAALGALIAALVVLSAPRLDLVLRDKRGRPVVGAAVFAVQKKKQLGLPLLYAPPGTPAPRAELQAALGAPLGETDAEGRINTGRLLFRRLFFLVISLPDGTSALLPHQNLARRGTTKARISAEGAVELSGGA
jgi:hypothetical protein